MSDCEVCEGECGECEDGCPTLSPEAQKVLIREGIAELTRSLAENPDLAAKLFLVLKLAAERK